MYPALLLALALTQPSRPPEGQATTGAAMEDATRAAAIEKLAATNIEVVRRMRQGMLEEALPLAAAALALVEETGLDDPSALNALRNAGVLARLHGDRENARDLLQGALRQTRKVFGDDSPEAASIMTELSALHYDIHELGEAKELLERALDIRTRKLPPLHLDTLMNLSDLATVHGELGETRTAVTLLERARDGMRRRPVDDDTAVVVANLGKQYEQLGDWRRAKASLEVALQIREKVVPVRTAELSMSLNDLGTLLMRLGNHGAARPLLERALKLRQETFGEKSPRTATSYDALAMLEADADHLEVALRLAHRALQARRASLPPQHPDIAWSLSNLGSLYERAGDREAAVRYKRGALEYRRRSGAPPRELASSLDDLGVLLAASGKLAEGRRGADEALRIREAALGPSHPDTAESLRHVAFLHAFTGRLRLAVNSLTHALEAEERSVKNVLRAGSRPEKDLFMRTMTISTHEAVTLHFGYARKRADAERLALATILRRKGRALEFNRDSRMRSHATAGDGAEDPASVTVEAVQARLAPADALVEYFVHVPGDPLRGWGSPRYVAYVLRRDRVRSIDLGPAAAIYHAVLALRGSLAERLGDVLGRARALDKLAMQRVRPLLGDARHLVVAPDGVLSAVPFAALVAEDVRFLVERYDEMSMVTSGRDLLRAEAPPPRSEPLIVAAPAFDAGPEASAAPVKLTDLAEASPLSFGPLTATVHEAKAIARVLGVTSERVLLGERATEGAVRRAAGPRILHLATHGFFLPDEGAEPDGSLAKLHALGERALSRSGLALAGFNRSRASEPGDDDGVLTAREVLDLDLAGTQVVVLSACETGLGESIPGEGVYGLTRAFVLAGARSQMLTLWAVGDDQTRDLMESWYGQVKAGIGRAEALRSVQRAALRGEPLPAIARRMSTRGARATPDADLRIEGTRHPFYWASLTLTGEIGPLSSR